MSINTLLNLFLAGSVLLVTLLYSISFSFLGSHVLAYRGTLDSSCQGCPLKSYIYLEYSTCFSLQVYL